MGNNYYWLAYWLEKDPAGSVNAYRTAVQCETLARAVSFIGAMMAARANEHPGMQCLLYEVGLGDEGAADLVGVIGPDYLGIDDWPEEV